MISSPVIIQCDQGTPEWDACRIGIPTASNFDRIITTKGQPSKSRTKYLYELAAERFRNSKTPTFQSWQMREGIKNESDGRAQYASFCDVDVQQVGLVYRDDRRDCSCSPDGLIGEDGGLELKWTEPGTQLERLLKGWSDATHFQQVQGNLYVTVRKWWDLMSYSDGLPPLIIRFYRDETFIAALAKEIDNFLMDLGLLMKEVKAI